MRARLVPALLLASCLPHASDGHSYDGHASRAPSGAELFFRTWTDRDPRSVAGDGVGPLYNESSCAACHGLGGPGGAGPASQNVRLGIVGSSGKGDVTVLHRYTVDPTWAPVPATSSPTLERNPTAMFGDGLIDRIPDEAIEAMATEHDGVSGRVNYVGDAVARFGWKADAPHLDAFVARACAVEVGLEVPGQHQTMPALTGDPPGLDLDARQLDALVAYVASLPRPERVEAPGSERGEVVFREIGCVDCHVPDVAGVEGVYSDLLLHDMGSGLDDRRVVGGYYSEEKVVATTGPGSAEWRTPPLWGVRDSGPWLHDGRAETLDDAIVTHGGEAQAARERYVALRTVDRVALITFLQSMAAPPPR